MRVTNLFIAIIFTSACTKEHFSKKENDYSQAEAFKKAEIKYLQDYKSTIVGEWKIDSIHMKLGLIQIPNSKDTMVFNYGKIVITALESDQIQPEKLNSLKGYIVANKDTLPIHSNLLAMPGESQIDSINSVFGAVESNYHIEGTTPFNKLPITYQFLSEYMLGDNFKMYLDATKTKLIWKGSRFIVQINLTKIK